MLSNRSHAARRAIAVVGVAGLLGTPATIALASSGDSQAARVVALAAPAIAAPIADGIDVGSSVTRLAHRAALSTALRSARRLARARGVRLPHDYAATLRRQSVRQLLSRTSRLQRQLRDFKRYGGAPAVAIPAQLAAIANCESHSNPRAIGGGGAFRGKYQFDYGTWASVGGHGDPAAAPEAEQDRRAAMLYARSGAAPWPVCGR